MVSRVSRSWKAFPSWALRREGNFSADACQVSAPVTCWKRCFHCLLLVFMMRLSQMAQLHSHLLCPETQTRTHQSDCVIRHRQSHIHVEDECCAQLTFPGMRRAGRRTPCTLRSGVWEKLQGENDRLVASNTCLRRLLFYSVAAHHLNNVLVSGQQVLWSEVNGCDYRPCSSFNSRYKARHYLW